MPSLPAEVRLHLPPLGTQQHLADPWVYAKFGTADSPQACYVTEGSPHGEDFRFFGYVVKDERNAGWGFFTLLELAKVQPALSLDSSFVPGRFIEVVLGPWLKESDSSVR